MYIQQYPGYRTIQGILWNIHNNTGDIEHIQQYNTGDIMEHTQQYRGYTCRTYTTIQGI